MAYNFDTWCYTEGFDGINLKDFKVRQLLTEKLQSPINMIECQDAIVEKLVLEENLIKIFPEKDWQPFLGSYVAVEVSEDLINKLKEISKGPFNSEPKPPKTEDYFKGERLVNLVKNIAKGKSDFYFVININDYYTLMEYSKIEEDNPVDPVTKLDVLRTGMYATINQIPIYVNKKVEAGNLNYGFGNFDKEKVTHLNYLKI